MDCRAPAEMTPSAVDHDAGKDDGHARDADQVRQVLGPDALVRVVGCLRRDVDGYVEDAAERHEPEPEKHEEGQPREAPDRLYHRHVLEIHLSHRTVNSIAGIRL